MSASGVTSSGASCGSRVSMRIARRSSTVSAILLQSACLCLDEHLQAPLPGVVDAHVTDGPVL